MKKKNRFRLFPNGTFLPIAVCLLLTFLIFYGTGLLPNVRNRIVMSTVIDEKIPFIPEFVVIYFAAFLQWAANYLILAHSEKREMYLFLSAEIIGKIICGIIFIILPCTMVRATITGNTVFDRIVAFLYSIDRPVNLFPSEHCMYSTLCTIAAFRIKKLPKWYRIFSVIMTMLVCASVVFVKQHVFADIPSGIVMAFICMFAAEKTHFTAGYEKMIENLQKKLAGNMK